MDVFDDSFRDDLEARRGPSWREPFHWWGPSWHRPQPRSLGELVEDGVLDQATAAGLGLAVQEGGSMVVAAGPSRIGKSTLAGALAAEIPTEIERVYVRGGYETFDFVERAGVGGRVLLVNELSPHLPIYLWGGAARRVLGVAGDGAQMIATIHADSPEEVVYQLARQPVGATPDEIAALGTVVFLGPPAADGGDRWRVSRIVRLRAAAHGITVEDISKG